jgi:hypothetical protein
LKPFTTQQFFWMWLLIAIFDGAASILNTLSGNVILAVGCICITGFAAFMAGCESATMTAVELINGKKTDVVR